MQKQPFSTYQSDTSEFREISFGKAHFAVQDEYGRVFRYACIMLFSCNNGRYTWRAVLLEPLEWIVHYGHFFYGGEKGEFKDVIIRLKVF